MTPPNKPSPKDNNIPSKVLKNALVALGPKFCHGFSNTKLKNNMDANIKGEITLMVASVEGKGG